MARLESLTHTDEIVQLKQKLKAWSYRGFDGQDPRKLFQDFCRRSDRRDRPRSSDPSSLDCEQFLKMCRKGGKLAIPADSKKHDEISELFVALDLNGDGLVTIDEITAFVWDEPPPLPEGDDDAWQQSADGSSSRSRVGSSARARAVDASELSFGSSSRGGLSSWAATEQDSDTDFNSSDDDTPTWASARVSAHAIHRRL